VPSLLVSSQFCSLRLLFFDFGISFVLFVFFPMMMKFDYEEEEELRASSQ